MITLLSEEELFTRLMALAAVQFPSQDLSDKGFLGLLARLHAQLLTLLEKAVADADADAVPAYKQDVDGTLLSRCSSAALDAWAITYGLPSGVAGIYGRKGATRSTGGVGLPGCLIAGTLIPAGSLLIDPSGAISIETTADVTTDGPPNTVTARFRSITTGAQANLPASTVLTWVAPLVGMDPTVTLTAALTGGVDRETDGALLDRILFRLQHPPRGGTAADYRYWTEASEDNAGNSNAIARAHVYPLRSGAGAVDVLPLVAGSGPGRDPGAAARLIASEYVAKLRPVTATVNMLQPTMTRALRVRVRAKPHERYPYDWDDGAVSVAIVAIDKPNKTISCVMPANLKASIDAGSKPRLQVVVSTANGTPLPVQVQAVSYVIGAPDVITLSSWPFLVDPTPGTDFFWAGGPIVDACAAGILAYVDSLGPSRQSGFADEFDVWDDRVTLARIADIIMETRDGDGTRMVKDIPALVTNGIQIAVGGGAFNAASFIPLDAGAPELAFLRAGGIEIIGAP